MRVSLFQWNDGKTISCHVWTNDQNIRWYRVNIEEAKGLYPDLSMIQAVKKVARDRFKRNEA